MPSGAFRSYKQRWLVFTIDACVLILVALSSFKGKTMTYGVGRQFLIAMTQKQTSVFWLVPLIVLQSIILTERIPMLQLSHVQRVEDLWIQIRRLALGELRQVFYSELFALIVVIIATQWQSRQFVVQDEVTSVILLCLLQLWVYLLIIGSILLTNLFEHFAARLVTVLVFFTSNFIVTIIYSLNFGIYGMSALLMRKSVTLVLVVLNCVEAICLMSLLRMGALWFFERKDYFFG